MAEKYSFRKKAVAWILSVCLVVTLIPNIGYAAGSSNAVSGNGNKGQSVSGSRAVPADEVTEENVVEKTESTTTYALGNGEQMTVFHGGQVRYRDENGRLRDYDPALVGISDGEKSEQDKDLSGYSVRNNGGDMKQYMPDMLGEATPVIMENDKYSISITPENETLKEAGIDNEKLEVEKRKIPTIYEEEKNLPVDAVYGSSENTAVFTYTSGDHGVKETITLNEKPESNVFRYVLDVGSLKAKKNATTEGITIYDEESADIVAAISAPWMNDATGRAYSEDITYSLEETEEAGRYILTMTVDEEYLSDRKRKYPVTIDPTTTWTGQTQVNDAYVISGSTYGNTNFYDSGTTSMPAGKNSTGTHETYIRFPNLKSTIAGKTITAATFSAYEVSGSVNGQNVGIFKVSSSWSPASLTYNNRPATAGSALSSITTQPAAVAHSFNVLSYAQNVGNGTAEDYGLALKNISSSPSYAVFFGSRSSYSSYRPKLSVTYTDTPTTAVSAGISPAYVNDSTAASVTFSGITATNLARVEYRVAAYDDDTASAGNDIVAYSEDTAITSGGKLQNLVEGCYRVYVRGVNTAGTAGTEKSAGEIHVDKTAPSIGSITFKDSDGKDINKKATGEADPVITFTEINDKHIETTGIKYALVPSGQTLQASDFKTPEDMTVNNLKPYSGTFTFNAADTAAASGEYTLYVRAEDLAGNAKTKQFTYIKDVDDPEGSVTITSLVTGAEISQIYEPVNIEIDVDGTGSELQETSLKLYKLNQDSETGALSIIEGSESILTKNFIKSENIVFDTLNMCDGFGKYRLALYIKDSVGKTKEVTKDFDFTYTVSAPEITVSPSNGTTATLTWDFKYTPQQKVKLTSLKGKYGDSGSWQTLVPSGENGTIPFSGSANISVPSEEGNWTLHLYATTSDGQTSAESTAVCIVDKTAPQLALYTFDQGIIYGEATDTHSCTCTVYAREKDAQTYWDEPVATKFSGGYESTLAFVDVTKAPFTAGGEYTLKVDVEDIAGNVTSDTMDIAVPDDGTNARLIEAELEIENRKKLSSGGFIVGTGSQELTLKNNVQGASWYINNSKVSAGVKNLAENTSITSDNWNEALATVTENGVRKYSVSRLENGIKQSVFLSKEGNVGTQSIFAMGYILSFRIKAQPGIATYKIKTSTGSYVTIEPDTTYHICDIDSSIAYTSVLDIQATALPGKDVDDADIVFYGDMVTVDFFMYSDVENYAPQNLSADDKVNYKTYLKWDIPENLPENISYEVYRSTEKGFTPDDTTKIASGIKAGYFTEINTGHGKTFYYRVCAVKPYTDYNGQTAYLKSSFSEEQASRVADQNESVKKLGMKDFWEFTQFNTPNGNGYIEKSGGNFLYQQKDAEIPNEGLDVHLTRVYNSQSSIQGTFGFGWSHDYDIELINVCENGSTAYTHMALKDGDGTIYHFTRDTGESEYVSTLGSYVSLNSFDEEITKNVSISGNAENESREIKYKFLLSTKDGVCYYFNSGGQLILMEDNNGRFVVFEHDINKGLLSRMVTNNNIAIEFTYNDGKDGSSPLTIKEISMPDGSRVQYEYTNPILSSEQLLTKVTEVSGNETIEYEYEYDKPLLSSQPQNLTVIKEAQNKYKYKINYDYETDQVTDVVYPDDEKFTFTYSPDNTCTVTKKYSGGQFVLGEKDFFERISGKCVKSIRGVTEQDILNGTNENGLDVTEYLYHSNVLVSSTRTAQYYEVNQDQYVVKKSGTKTGNVSYSGDNPVKETEEDGTVSEYTYYTAEDGEHLEDLIRTVKETGASGKVSSYKKYTYDTAGNVTETVDYAEKTKITNTYYTEGAFKGELHTMKEYLITVTGEDQIASESLKSTSVYSYQYNTEDGVTTKTESCTQTIPKPDGTNEVMTTATIYDVMGRVIRETDSRGYQSIYTYDGFGRVTETTYKYSESDQLKQHTEKNYDKNGMVTYEKVEDGIEKWYTYDNMGRITSTRVKKGDIDETINTTYRYEDVNIYQGKGNETVSVENAYVTRQAYSDGTIISEIYEDHTGHTVRAYEGGLYTDMTYSSQGDMITKWCMGTTLSGTDGLLEIYIHDEKGNLTQTITDPGYAGGTNTTGYFVRSDETDDEGNTIQGSIVTENVYDADGNVTEQTDPKGNTTKYTYDKTGDLTSVLLPNQAKYEYRYDVEGENNTTMDIVLEPRVTGTDADRLMSKSIVVKDSTDKTIKVEDLGISDSDGTSISTTYEYDIRDNLIKATEKNGSYKSYTYDARDRVTAIDYYEMADGSAVKTLKTEFTYDDADNLTSMTDKEIAEGGEVIYRYTAYGYDGMNRLIWVSECDTAAVPSQEVINAHKVSYGYDSRDRLVSIDYAGSTNGVKGLRFTYNIHGWLTKVEAVNSNGNEKTIREYSYTGDGKVNLITDYTDFLSGTGKWLKRAYTYDKLNRVTAIEYTDNMTGSSTEVKESHTYEYDKNNNIVSEAGQSSYGVANGADYSEEYSYHYDANNRLIFNQYYKMATESESGDSAEITYTYDAAGNRTGKEVFKSGATGSMTFESSYTYNEFNQLTGSVEESREDYIRTAYTYDTNGNQISKTTTDAYTNTQTGQTVYTYDAANRLKTATGTTGGAVDYVQENKYNGFGQRVEKKEGSDVTEYFYDGSAVLYTKDETGTTTSFNLIGAEDNILSTSRKDADGQTDFYVYTKDIRESTTNVIGKDGLSQVSYTYDEHGETTEYQKNEAAPFYNEICYTAGVYDATTGLYNLNARYYSPEAGVFLTQDTYRGSRSRTGTLNYYAYCAGNPISYTDPSGHNPVAVILRAASIAFAVAGVYSTYKNAKKKGYSKKKTAVAVAVSAAINFAPVGKVKAAAEADTISKFTKAAISAAKTGKTVKNVLSQPKVPTTLNKTAQEAVKNATAKKTAQTLGRQQKRVGSSACFTAGTKIHTKDGFKNIEAIKAGDYVWSENPETHEKALKKVKKIFVREKDSIIRLAINGETIETTAEHPFYVEGRGFTSAGELKAGDEVRIESGEEAFVESTEEVHLSEPVNVYNFEVEDFHTYYVSEQKVLVHNTCPRMTELTKNNTRHIVGQNGTKVDSLTLWQKGKTERIDIENFSPGKVPGNIHYHDGNNKKWIYNLDDNKFYDYDTGEMAPRKIQNLLKQADVKRYISKGKKYLGEE